MAKHDLNRSKETELIEFELEPEILAKLKTLAKAQKVTVETLIVEAITEHFQKGAKADVD